MLHFFIFLQHYCVPSQVLGLIRRCPHSSGTHHTLKLWGYECSLFFDCIERLPVALKDTMKFWLSHQRWTFSFCWFRCHASCQCKSLLFSVLSNCYSLKKTCKAWLNSIHIIHIIFQSHLTQPKAERHKNYGQGCQCFVNAWLTVTAARDFKMYPSIWVVR